MSATRKVLVSPGWGAGWSTWNTGKAHHDFLFDAKLIEAVEAVNAGGDRLDFATALADFEARMIAKHGECGYLGGARDLEVATVGGQFKVDEYDGYESITSRDDDDGWL